MSRIIIGIVLGLIAIVPQAGAQGFNIGLEGGLQGMRYSLPNGQSKLQPGGALSLGYGIRLASRWDLLTGVSGGIYRTQATLRDGVVASSGQVDDLGSAFEYSVQATGYQETQRFFAASVPVLFQFHTLDPGVQWYFDGGGKVFLPFGTNVQVSAKQLVLSGYYPDFNIDVSNLPQHGFGTINGWKANATTKLKPSAALSAATGASFPLSPGTRLYAGVFVDYGLTSLKQKSDSMPLASYNSTGLTGVQSGGVLNRGTTGQATLLSFGVQLRLTFGLTRAKHAAATRPETIKESQPPAKDTLGDDDRDMIETPVVFGLLDETAIPEIQKKHLDEVANILKRYPAIHLSITGHVCNSDVETEDKKVGVDRAKAVAQYLRGKGIDAGRLDVNPVAESDVTEPFNPLANYRNRRVAIKIK